MCFGNPPWERIKLQEEEFFASREPLVASAKNKAERGQRIRWLSEGSLAYHIHHIDVPPEGNKAERALYREFITSRRLAEAMSVFAHVDGDEGGRFPLTGVGDVNTYALFAESFKQIIQASGRAGFIVPTGIATDDSTKAYFAHIAESGKLTSLFDFENREGIFPVSIAVSNSACSRSEKPTKARSPSTSHRLRSLPILAVVSL